MTQQQPMYRGTTPKITLNIVGADLTDATTWPTVIVTIENGQTTFDVTRDKLTITKASTGVGCSVSFALTQDETLAMSMLRMTRVQLRAKTVDGYAIATEIASVSVEDILKDGEI
jgi:ABC-type uncharacterized transport system ATPase subunit